MQNQDVKYWNLILYGMTIEDYSLTSYVWNGGECHMVHTTGFDEFAWSKNFMYSLRVRETDKQALDMSGNESLQEKSDSMFAHGVGVESPSSRKTRSHLAFSRIRDRMSSQRKDTSMLPLIVGGGAIVFILGFFFFKGRMEPVSCMGVLVGCILILVIVFNWHAIGQSTWSALTHTTPTHAAPLHVVHPTPTTKGKK